MPSRPFLSSAVPSISGAAQPWLPGFAPEHRHKLFLAIHPDAATKIFLVQLIDRLRTRSGLRGKAIHMDHLHLSLVGLGEDVDLREDVIDATTNALSTLASNTPPFSVTLDRIFTFRRNKSPLATVLRETTGNTSLHHFYYQLYETLIRARLGRHLSKSFAPHVTLLYDPKTVPEHRISPVTWTVNEIVLIESLVGETRHIVRGRYPLLG